MQINIANILTFACTLDDITLDSLITALHSQRMERYARRIGSYPATNAAEDELINHGRTVEAIKAYKTRLGLSLHAAYQVIQHRRNHFINEDERNERKKLGIN